MPPENSDRLSKIEDLKAKLFSKNFKTKVEHRDNFSHADPEPVTDSWVVKDNGMMVMGEKFFMKTSFFKKFFIFSSIFFILALAYGAYMFFAGGNTVSNNNIDISILGNSFAGGGEELPLQIGITNKNNLALELVDLVIEYPKSSSGDLSGETERIRESLGTIPSGAVRNENIKIVLFGEQGSVRPIRITMEYRVEGSNAIFVKEKLYEVNISSTPMNISVEAPSEVSPNQEIALKIKTTLNATRAASGVLLKVDYPVGFQFVSANPAPTNGNNVWALGDLAPGAEREISLVGKMIDVFDGEEKTIRVWAGSQSKTDKSLIDVVFNSVDHLFAIKRPFIEAGFSIGGVKKREYAIDSKSEVSGEIRWVNNSDTKINDLEIRAKITGNAIDRKSIRPERGFYDSATDTIIWDKNYMSDFAETSPGESGSVRFFFSPMPLVSSISGITNSPSVIINIAVTGKQEVLGFEPKELKNSDSITIRVVSDVGFANKALYYSGPLTNTGNIPPKVQKETTYTIVWSLSNSANGISKAVVRSTLPAWATFVGPISPPSEDLTYNSSTRELVWKVGNINHGVGITSPTKELFFRIAFSPSLSQLGTSPYIINDAVLTGHDDFANVDVRVSKPPLSTRLVSDPNFPPGGERVIE